MFPSDQVFVGRNVHRLLRAQHIHKGAGFTHCSRAEHAFGIRAQTQAQLSSQIILLIDEEDLGEIMTQVRADHIDHLGEDFNFGFSVRPASELPNHVEVFDGVNMLIGDLLCAAAEDKEKRQYQEPRHKAWNILGAE